MRFTQIMRLLKIGIIFLSVLLLNKVCLANKTDGYWDEIPGVKG